MKKLTYIILLVTASINAQNLVIDCYSNNNIIRRGETVVIDTLKFNCVAGLLVQDNAKITIQNVIGTGTIRRGGSNGAPTINGIDRFPNDASPTIRLIGCIEKFNSITFTDDVDVMPTTTNCDEN